MNATSLITRIAAILSTLNGTDGGPESSLYLAIGDLHEWQTTRNAMIALGWITVRASWVSLTEAGKAKADEVDNLIASK